VEDSIVVYWQVRGLEDKRKKVGGEDYSTVLKGWIYSESAQRLRTGLVQNGAVQMRIAAFWTESRRG